MRSISPKSVDVSKPDVLRVLAVNLFDALRDDQLNARPFLSVRRSFARRTTTFRQTRNDDRKAAVLHFVLLDGAVAHADVNVFAQRLVIVETNPTRRDLVG